MVSTTHPCVQYVPEWAVDWCTIHDKLQHAHMQQDCIPLVHRLRLLQGSYATLEGSSDSVCIGCENQPVQVSDREWK
jgi:hypothetical protein